MRNIFTATVLAMTAMLLSACSNSPYGAAPNAATPPLGGNSSPGISWNASQVQPFTPLQLDDNSLQMLGQWELQDLGVGVGNGLFAGAMHSATPAALPGGQVITTRQLVQLLSQSAAGSVLVLDVLGGPQRLPGAQSALPAAQPGDFDDQTQRQFGEYLESATGGNRAMPIVTYCQSRECWMSYNAALRALALGYTNVMWYRGGIQAWTLAGRPVEGGPLNATAPMPAPMPAQMPQPTQTGAEPESLWSKLMKPVGALAN